MLGGDPAIESQGEPNWLPGRSLFEEHYSLPVLNRWAAQRHGIDE
jgi:hypothetical protein